MDLTGVNVSPKLHRLPPRMLRGRLRLLSCVAFALGAILTSTALYIRSMEQSVMDYELESKNKQFEITDDSRVTRRAEEGGDRSLRKTADDGSCSMTSTASAGGEYSSFECLDDGESTFIGLSGIYGFTIVNRSCVYRDVAFDPESNKFFFYAPDTPQNRALLTRKELLPVVNLASRPYDLPILHRKRVIIKRKVGWTFEYTPQVILGPIPRCIERDERIIGYYTPIVAPWNFAHTLYCDLFPLFWMMHEFNMTNTLDVQVVATSSHYMGDFPLPNKNKAFDFFSRRPPMYDVHLPRRVYSALLVGSGTKTWSWVTKDYAASGNSPLWQAFRKHVVAVTGAVDRVREPLHPTKATETHADVSGGASDQSRPIRVSICHKKDKRGVVNYEETVGLLQRTFPNRRKIEFVLEGAVGKSAKEQVQMMIDADVYMCNEGTLATALMFLPPGGVFLSLPLVYHSPHLHQRKMPDPKVWWRMPDMLRPDPRKNTGGNIDWFPPSIRWVKTMWYHVIPLNETQIQLPLVSLRNYMPDMNIVIQDHRIVALMQRAIAFLEAKDENAWTIGASSGEIEVLNPSSSLLTEDDGGPRPPNYSINADLCRQMLNLDPNMTRAFNSARCFYGMSWLCEFWTNTRLKWRRLHEKWSLSKGRCGGKSTALEHLPEIVDPRVRARRLSEYLFYTKEELLHSYTTLDLGNFTVSEEEVADVFP